MGAETETDGQGDAMKQKWHKLYDNTATYYIFGIVMLIFGLSLIHISEPTRRS